MNVLVTGAAGLYGVHLVDELVRKEYVSSVVGVDNFSRQFLSEDPFIKSGEFYSKFRIERMDYMNISPEDIDSSSIDAVVHLAASISIPESMESIEKQNLYLENNARGTLKLLQTLLESEKQPLLVYASSPEVYGNPQYTPMDEKHPMNPRSIYAATKVAAEKFIYAYQEWLGYPAVVIRNFNTFGPNQNVWKDAAVIANFTYKALKNEPIEIHGDGEQTRDFQYVADAVRAYSLAIENKERLRGSTFNIGTGVQTTINELACLIKEITGSSSEIRHTQARSADLIALEADCSEIKAKLGWVPEYSLPAGLAKTIPWYEDVLRASDRRRD